MTKGRPSRAAAPRARSRSSARTPALSDLDLRILDLLASHRVLTQTQLASINPETPGRTLRYRCARLAREGLAGRSRPYRERGSAPHHFWPTRKGEAIVIGGPPPRGGERREPNPLFLAHAAGLSEIYVALETALPAEMKLARFEREADVREPFTAWASREKRAIAPDAFIEITDADGGSLLAFIELDMGSMSHRRLKTKAGGYAEYVRVEAWRERHSFCPALLFVTTIETRARSFLAAMETEAGRNSLLLTCACDLARRLPRFASEDRWLLSIDEGKRAVELLSALRETRRPFDEEQERLETERRCEDAERERLRSDPEALRLHLRSRSHRDWGSELGHAAAAALMFTLEQDDALDEVEREALSTLGAMFADPLGVQLADRELTAGERRAFDALVPHHLARQLDWVGDLAQRFGEGPALRKARKHLQSGAHLDRDDLSWRLSEEAKRDGSARAKQKRLHEDYFGWREQRARQLAKAQGILGRFRNRAESFLDEVDRRSLRLCRSCEEVAYPDPEWARYERGAHPDVAGHCHFCGAEALAEIEPATDEGRRR